MWDNPIARMTSPLVISQQSSIYVTILDIVSHRVPNSKKVEKDPISSNTEAYLSHKYLASDFFWRGEVGWQRYGFQSDYSNRFSTVCI